MQCGYGRIKYENRVIKAHRASWELHKGSISKGLNICHHCDNTRCVNPDHLFMGTQKQNVHDMISKKRNSFGAKRPNAKLTEDQVLEMRELRKNGLAITAIAKQYNIGGTTAFYAIKGIQWKHVN